jgi:hypothetical protein
MSRRAKRKITVLNKEYLWVLDGNTIDSHPPQHIKVHAVGATKSILYLDPYNWHFEVRPQTVERAIKFAITKGWIPEENTTPISLSMNSEGEFYILPDGIQFGYQDNK